MKPSHISHLPGGGNSSRSGSGGRGRHPGARWRRLRRRGWQLQGGPGPLCRGAAAPPRAGADGDAPVALALAVQLRQHLVRLLVQRRLALQLVLGLLQDLVAGAYKGVGAGCVGVGGVGRTLELRAARRRAACHLGMPPITRQLGKVARLSSKLPAEAAMRLQQVRLGRRQPPSPAQLPGRPAPAAALPRQRAPICMTGKLRNCPARARAQRRARLPARPPATHPGCPACRLSALRSAPSAGASA
jgi:hypothetical protein